MIASFYFYRNLRTINNYLILNLAIADLIIGVYSMNVYTVYVTQGECLTKVNVLYVGAYTTFIGLDFIVGLNFSNLTMS